MQSTGGFPDSRVRSVAPKRRSKAQPWPPENVRAALAPPRELSGLMADMSPFDEQVLVVEDQLRQTEKKIRELLRR